MVRPCPAALEMRPLVALVDPGCLLGLSLVLPAP